MPRRKKRYPTRKVSIFHIFRQSKGSITFTILLSVIIIGSIAFVSGVFPKSQITPQDPDAPTFKPIFTEDPLNRDSLQLKTIDFESCSSTVAIEMVLDRSGSMGGQKIQNLKNASLFFISRLPDNAPLGLIAFSNTVSEEFEIQDYNIIKPRVNGIIQGMRAGGFTHTREALLRAKTALEIGMPKYPERQFSLILVTDGVPEISGQQFPPEQDPRTSPNVADEIKAMGVKIYSIGITQNVRRRQEMLDMLQSISSPNGFFEAPDTTTLNEIYNQIGFELCQQV